MVPYVVALFSSILWLYYAMLKKNAMLLVLINSFKCVMEMIYIILYITYVPRAPRVIIKSVLVEKLYDIIHPIIYIYFNLINVEFWVYNSTLKEFVSMNIGLFSLILLVTHLAVNEKFCIEFLGWICVVVSVSIFAAPLSIVVS